LALVTIDDSVDDTFVTLFALLCLLLLSKKELKFDFITYKQCGHLWLGPSNK